MKSLLKENVGTIVEFENQLLQSRDHKLELLNGLIQDQKKVSPKFFYDEYGSALFEKITESSEYYVTRTERKMLSLFGEEITDICGEGCVLIEPGSGSCEKVRLLLDSLTPKAYVPLDISSDFLYDAAVKLSQEYPWLPVYAVCADFMDSWHLPRNLPEGRRVVFYPGSTIGNLEPVQARKFLKELRPFIGGNGGVLIGVDLHKSNEVLNAAYNDAAGITAEFNLNVLNRLNQILGADFNLEAFSHSAFYNDELRRIEMHLVSKIEQSVSIQSRKVLFQKGETIHTENSYKYTPESFIELAESAGYRSVKTWFDNDRLFSLHFLSSLSS